MKKIFSFGLVALFFIGTLSSFFTIGCHAVDPHTLYVGGSEPGNYSSIQTAIDNASAGDTVFVFSGNYLERVVLATSVCLVGEDKTSTILDGGLEEYVVTIAADQCSVSGFTITRSGTMYPKAGIDVRSQHNTISGNILTGNFYGIRLFDGSGYNTISGNEIVDNKKCGVYFSRSSNNVLIGNFVSGHPFNGFGLYENSNNNTLCDNVLSSNIFTGVNIRDSFGNIVMKNRFQYNTVGLHVPLPEYGTIVSGNTFVENPIDKIEQQDSLISIGAGYGVFVLIVFFIFKKWKT